MATPSSSEHNAAGLQAADEPTLNLQVVSPSVGVNRPLLFPGIAASITIRQLKERIREALPFRPADEQQRLIHRGRALLRDSDKLIDVFGPEAFQQPDLYTIHLVIRDFSDNRPSSTPAAAPSVPLNQPPNAPLSQQPAPGSFVSPEPSAFAGRPPPPPQSAPPLSSQQQPTHPQMPTAVPLGQQLPEPAATVFQQQHQQLTAWLSQIQRDAMARAIVNQNQRGRAQGGMRGIGDGAAQASATSETNSGRGSPAPTQTVYREIHGPNEHSYHVETVVRPHGTVAAQQGGEAATASQHALRGSSRPPAGAMGAAMQRSTSGASLPGRSFAHPGVTVPLPHLGGSRPDSGRATPDPAGMPRSMLGALNMFTSAPLGATSSQGIELYLLSSPEGPRGVLINNSTMEAFYTPRNSVTPVRSYSPPRIPGVSIFDRPQDPRWEPMRREMRVPNQMRERQHVQPPAPANAAQPAEPGPQGLHPNNAAAVGGQPILVLILSYAWQAVRLGFFVWMFTTTDISWTKWFLVVITAILALAASAGILTPVAQFIWRPINRHIEHVFAALEHPDGRPRRRRGRNGTDPDPADMAARLTAQHQRRQTWLGQYYRMFKRVGILFLASIAPGVAERHIAILEAEAREELRRQEEAQRREEAEAAEAAASAEAAPAADAGTDTATETAKDGPGAIENQPASGDTGSGEAGPSAPPQNDDQGPAQEPLVAL